MKKKKVGLHFINWFLSIIGILFFLSLIILPPVFRVVFKEEPVKEELPEKIVLRTLTCSKSGIITEQYTDIETFTFHYYNNRIRTYSKKTERSYRDLIVYQSDKQSYGRYVTAFSVISGYEYLVDPNDDHFLLQITENFDLGLFQNTTVVIPGEETSTEVISPYTTEDDITSIQATLTTNGYICQ